MYLVKLRFLALVIFLGCAGAGLYGQTDNPSVRFHTSLGDIDVVLRLDTAPLTVVNFMNYEGWEWGKIAAGGSLVMAPVLIFSLAVRRYLVSGLTAGAVKG